MGNPYPSTGDVSYTSNETVEAVDHAWTPSHIRRNEVVTVVDDLRAERITFLRTQHEDLTAVDTVNRLALLTGTGATDKPAPGWEAKEFKKTVYRDMVPGEQWIFKVEDHLDYRTLCNATLWIQNTEGQKIHAKVVEWVVFDGRLDAYTLFDGTLVGKCIEPIELHQPLTMPSRVVYREVTLTNNEAQEDAYVIVLIGGWVGHATYLPTELPRVYGEGLQ